MKTPLALIKTFITSHFIIAGCSVVVLAVFHVFNHSSSMTHVQTREKTYHRSVKAQISDEQILLQAKENQLQEKEQQIKTLKSQLANVFNNPKPKETTILVKTSPQTPQVAENPNTFSSSSAPSPQPLIIFVPAPTSPQLVNPVSSSPIKPSSEPQTVAATFIPASPEQRTPPLPPKARKSLSPSVSPTTLRPKPSLTPSTQRKTRREIEQGITYANNILAGLVVAQNQGQIRHGTKEYNRYQDATILFRQGENAETVSRKANIPLDDLYHVIALGENRPGNDKYHPPVLQRDFQLADAEMDTPYRYALDIQLGLSKAHLSGQLRRETTKYKEVQTAIELLRKRQTLEYASRHSDQQLLAYVSRHSGVELHTLKQLITWGQEQRKNPIDLARSLEQSQSESATE